MQRPRLAFLNAGEHRDETGANFHREVDAELEEFHLPSGELPPAYEYDGFVVSGSWASVYWDEAWIANLKSWANEAIDRGLPALGVCFGHQLLADVLGGRVTDMGSYELGYRSVRHDGTDLLFEGIPREFTTFTSHSDHVSELPPGAEIIARNDVGIQGFRRDRVFAVQFHPEYDLEMAETVTKKKRGELAESRIQDVLAGITAETYEAARPATRIFDNFAEFVSSRDDPVTAGK
ncbi:MAG: type 1 glutamine amidotransferase [Halobacteriota archaeon]